MFVDEKAVGEKEPVKVGTLKLSEAIRIGASKRPQCVGRYFSDYGESCAIGAAAEALFGVNRMSFTNKHSWQLEKIYGDGPMYLAINWNDSGKYTREQIADMLAARGL